MTNTSQSSLSQQTIFEPDFSKFDELYELKQKYLDLPNLWQMEGINVLVSGTGTGKTQLISSIPKELSVLAITPKKNGVKQFINRFQDFESHYEGKNAEKDRVKSKQELGEYHRQVMTSVSLNRFEEFLVLPDVLIIDEVVEVMTLSIAGKKNSYERVDGARPFYISNEVKHANEDMLHYLLKNTKCVLVMSADVDSYCAEYILSKGRKTRAWLNNYQNKRDKTLKIVSDINHLEEIVKAKCVPESVSLTVLENSKAAIANYSWKPDCATVFDAGDVAPDTSFESAVGLGKSFGAKEPVLFSTPVISTALSFTDVDTMIVANMCHSGNRFLTGTMNYQMLSRARTAENYYFLSNPNLKQSVKSGITHVQDKTSFRTENPNRYDKHTLFIGNRWKRSELDYRAYYYRLKDYYELDNRLEVAIRKWMRDGGSVELEAEYLPKPSVSKLNTILRLGRYIKPLRGSGEAHLLFNLSINDFYYTAACNHASVDELTYGYLDHWRRGRALIVKAPQEDRDLTDENNELGNISLELASETYWTKTGLIGRQQFAQSSSYSRLVRERLVFNRLVNNDELRHLTIDTDFEKNPLAWLETFLLDFGFSVNKKPFDPKLSGSKVIAKKNARIGLNQYLKAIGKKPLKTYEECYSYCIGEGIAGPRISNKVIEFIKAYETEVLLVQSS